MPPGIHLETKDILLAGATIMLLVPLLLWWWLGLKRFFPLAVVQIFTGVLLGPTFFGVVAPDLFKTLFTDQPGLKLAPATSIGAIATVAVSLFAFNAGTEADLAKVRRSGLSVLAIGAGGLILTWALGTLAGLALVGQFPGLAGPAGPLPFALGFGLCNAVPALPILAAMLNELGLANRHIGQVMLGAAALGDAILWGSVAILVAVASGSGGPAAGGGAASAWQAAALALAGAGGSYVLCTLVMGPLLTRLEAAQAPERVIMTLVAITVFASATLTAVAGLHAVIGAFLAGVLLPEKVREQAAHKLDMPTALILLPFFFLATGLKANLQLGSVVIWSVFLTGIAVCFFGKVVASVVCARAAGESLAFGTMAGVLLQTKGLMELVIVTIFAQKGLVSPETFSAVVAIALVSTALTMPVARLILSRADHLLDSDATAEKSRPRAVAAV